MVATLQSAQREAQCHELQHAITFGVLCNALGPVKTMKSALVSA